MFKYLAALFMLIDHLGSFLGYAIPPDIVIVMRQIGRLAYPMFAYIVAKNIDRSSNLPRYFVRLLIAASVTQLIFQALHVIYTHTYIYVNTIFTFALGIAMVTGLRLIFESSRDMLLMVRPATHLGEADPDGATGGQIQLPVNFGGVTLPAWMGLFSGIILTIIVITTTLLLNPDYGLYGVLMIVVFYFLNKRLPSDTGPFGKESRFSRTLAYFVALLVLNLFYLWNRSAGGLAHIGQFQMVSTMAVLLFPLESIREKRPGKFSKRFFYIFYPAHIAILMIISNYIT